jgi:hypothetical protein
MIPLYGFLEGDTIGLLVLAYPQDSMDDLVSKVQNSAAIRIKPRPFMQLQYKNELVAADKTVLELGMLPLEHFFVVEGRS